jgi:hypothetical protein
MDVPGKKQLWRAIHIVGKTFTPKDDDIKSSFACFFYCLGDLLPDETYRKTLKSFIKQTPPERYTDTSERAFRWTYELHSYVNLVKKRRGQLVDEIGLSDAKDLYSNITKKDWGNSFWFVMHYVAANLPDKMTKDHQTSFIALIMSIRFLIPCEECKSHMAAYIAATDIRPFMTSSKKAFQWTWTFHNNVSGRTGKKVMGFGEAYNLYVENNKIYSMIDY